MVEQKIGDVKVADTMIAQQRHMIGQCFRFCWQAINSFIKDLGITRAEGGIHFHKLEHAVRADADANAPRCLAVLRPLRVVITNLAEDHYVEVEAKVRNNHRAGLSSRKSRNRITRILISCSDSDL